MSRTVLSEFVDGNDTGVVEGRCRARFLLEADQPVTVCGECGGQNLDRNTAIKILSAAFSADCDRLVRFEQEARSASALNHPSIVTIYELGQDGSTHEIGRASRRER